MKICHVTSVHDLRHDARILPKMASSAAQAGHAVVVVAPEREGLTGDVPRDVQLHRVPVPDGHYQRWKCLSHVICTAASFKADLYHLHDPELLPLANLLRGRSGASKVVMDFHELVWADLLTKEYIPFVFRKAASWIWPKMEKRWLDHIDGIILAEDSYAPYYSGYPRPAQVIHNFPLIPATLPDPPNPPEIDRPLEMVYIGALMPSRAIMEIVCAASLIAEQWHGGCQLHFYGPLDDQNYVRMLREKADPSIVNFHGILRQSELMNELSQRHVSFALFHESPSSYHSLPTKVLESILAGVPFVASNLPIVREIFAEAEYGRLLDFPSPDLIADAVLQIASDPLLYEGLAQAGRLRIAENYSWQKEANKLMAFYEKVMGSEQGGQVRVRNLRNC